MKDTSCRSRPPVGRGEERGDMDREEFEIRDRERVRARRWYSQDIDEGLGGDDQWALLDFWFCVLCVCERGILGIGKVGG